MSASAEVLVLNTLQLPRDRLAAMPANERGVLLLFGHISNEINLISKVSYFALQTYIGQKEPVLAAQFCQCLLFERLWAGKVHEAWVRFKDQFEADPAIRSKYMQKLEERCGDAEKRINKYFGKTNMITELRNSLAFHYPDSQELEESFQTLSGQRVWYWYIPEGQEPTNTFFHASEIAAAVATFRTTNLDSFSAAAKKVFDEVMEISNLVNKVIGAAISMIYDERLADTATRGPDFEVADLPPTDAVRLPFFTARPERTKEG